jgi:hypothetical protein
MINYSTNILTLQTDSTIDASKPDLVTGLYVNLVGIDDITGIVSSMVVYIKLEPGTTFIRYTELTSEIVSRWINSSAILANAKEFLATQIAERRSNSSEGVQLPPWIQLETSSTSVQYLPPSIYSQSVPNVRIITSSNTGTSISIDTPVTTI